MKILSEGYEDQLMGSWLNNEIPALLSMAHDRSERGRISLAERIAEVFLMNAEDLPEKEEKLVQNFINEILNSESDVVRQTLISKFATAVTSPRNVALRVSRGSIEIARGVLAANENLSDTDLISIIHIKGDEHAAAIATRTSISEAVCDALVTTGSMQVMQIVTENLGAHLSPKAIDILMRTARIASKFQKALIERPELSADKAIELYWWVSKDLRHQAMTRFGFGPGKLDQALTSSIEDKLTTHLYEKDSDIAMFQLADWLDERNGLVVRLLPKLLRMNHYRLFSVVLARMTKLEVSWIDSIIESPNSQLIVALCKSINVDKGSFVSLFLMSRAMREGEQIVNPKELSMALVTFDKLSVEDGQNIIRSWQENPSDLLIRSI